MFEDARKTSGHEKDFVVRDIAELVAEAVELDKLKPADLPDLVAQIAEAVAEKVADRVVEKLAGRIVAPALAQTAPAASEVPEPPSSPAAAAPGAWKAQAVTAAVLPAYAVPAKDGPRIMVTVKHAAKLGDEFAFTDDGRDVKSDFFDYVLNEWDDAALEIALQTVEAIGKGEVVAVAVGPENAEESLRRVLAKGAHRAVRVWADGVATADPIAVARLLAGVAKIEQPDLIFAGAQSSEHAQGATGTALARILDLPHAAVVIGVEWPGSGEATITRELEGGLRHTIKLPTPALVTVQTGTTPRYATLRMIKQARTKPLDVVDASAAGTAQGYAVRRMYVPPKGAGAQMWTGAPDEVAEKIAEAIRKFRGV